MRILLLAGCAIATLAIGGPLLTPAPRDALLEAMVQDSAVCSPSEGLRQREAFTAWLDGARAYAQTLPAKAGPDAPPPLMSGLGNAQLAIRTSNPAAQAYFNQGLNMLHGFNHAEAVRAFRHAQTLDPQCAMCFWGEAFGLGPNINAAMSKDSNADAYRASRRALELVAGTSPVEQALIEAMALRYSRDWPADRAPFDAAFADAMTQVAVRFPEVDLAQVLSAEADMDTQPWDYWQPGGRAPKGRIPGAIARIEKVLSRNPDNTGAIHLYIHLAEASTDPWRAEQAAGRLDRLAPNAGHLVHMPAHIYARVGRLRDSINLNIRAAEVDERYIKTANASATYQYGYYTHNLHFVATSAQSGGDAAIALAYADKLDESIPMQMAVRVPMSQPIKAAPWTVRAQFASPETILASAAPPPGVDFVTATWRYARAMALVRSGKIAAARDEAKLLADLAQKGDFSTLTSSGMPAIPVLEIYQHLIEGRALMAEGKLPDAIAELETAATKQDALPYSEPAWFYYPVRRTLGAAYLMNGQTGAAEQEFVQVLLANPNDAYAYWGIAEARKLRGDKTGSRAARELFKAAFLGKPNSVTVQSL